ncbi:cell envelope biogenesis protein TolA [Donghicola sp. XS_ASV15]|uniref:cell envelope biogenesis protein TolA n=1 Tax=Donghicola sp. XS_ASV15 TaxID=3241295 RepID=UPI003519BEB3
MKTGTYISGAGHTVLLLWVIFGGTFNSEPLPIENATDVSLISAEEFAALTAPQTAEDAEEVVPQPTEAETPQELDQALRPPELPVTPPQPEPEPEPEPEPVPQPEPEPVIPEVAAEAPDAPPSDTPTPEEAPRVAPEPVEAPPEDVEVAPERQEAADAEVPAEAPVQEEQQAAAPEAATTEIVTEAEEPASSMERSLRPMMRPNRPTPPPVETAEAEEPAEEEPPAETPAEEPEPAADPLAGALEGALAEALGGATSEPAPSRSAAPPLSAGEREGLRVSVQQCWVVDVGSQAANVTVVVGMNMNPDGTVDQGSINLVSASGGEGPAVETAYQAARRAILRCQRQGYPLPSEKYEQWKQIEMTFDPSQMRLR